MANYSVSVEVKVIKTSTGEVLLEGPITWPTNDYKSLILLQEAIFSGIVEKTAALGRATAETKR